MPTTEGVTLKRDVDQFHDQVVKTVLAACAVHSADVRMVQRGDRLRLAIEPDQQLRIRREACRKDLDRDVTPQSRIARPVDLTHPSGTDWCENLVCSETSARG
jgi:hypothetical protein